MEALSRVWKATQTLGMGACIGAIPLVLLPIVHSPVASAAVIAVSVLAAGVAVMLAILDLTGA